MRERLSLAPATVRAGITIAVVLAAPSGLSGLIEKLSRTGNVKGGRRCVHQGAQRAPILRPPQGLERGERDPIVWIREHRDEQGKDLGILHPQQDVLHPLDLRVRGAAHGLHEPRDGLRTQPDQRLGCFRSFERVVPGLLNQG